MKSIVKVIVPSPLRGSFDYLLPPELHNNNIKVGVRVLVPFGKRKLVGVVLDLAEYSEVSKEKLKSIITIIDDKPLFSHNLMALIHWASDYYHYSIGEVVLNALPKLLRQGKPLKSSEPIASPVNNSTLPVQLNSHQQIAVDAIDINTGFKTFLLDGVTGSGKTEVYLSVIEKVLNNGKQALILVPEIGLTPQIVERFQKKFAVNIAVFHSKLTDKERLAVWAQTKCNLAPIVIGTRSALFAPLAHLGIIILDEEHDLSFKQQAGFRYSARDLALVRAKLEKIPIILGSATPSLESIYNAKVGKYSHLHLPERAGQAIHPSFHIIDMRNKKVTFGLSAALIQKIQIHLNNNGQILLFLNRRGYAPTLLCQSCGWVAQCDYCDARMTLHQQLRSLHCHHCGAFKPILANCSNCSSSNLISLGFGTERLEEILQENFPHNSILRIDRDTTNRKNKMQEMLQAAQDNKYQILLGTQMLAKGHHFPNVTLAAIINVDSGLLSSDFRASEHIAQLIIQVAGRAGRAEKPGEVYIQTYSPEHPILLSLIHHGYAGFATKNLQERKLAKLPPFNYFSILRAEAKNKDLALQVLGKCKNLTATLAPPAIQLFGPVPTLMYRKNGYYRAQLLIVSSNRNDRHKFLKLIIQVMEKLKLTRKIRWSMEVDPVAML